MRLRCGILLLVLAITACSPVQPGPEIQTPTPSTTPTLLAPQVSITRVPEAQTAVQMFLEAWKAGSYESMYALLSRTGGELPTAEDFSRLYQETSASLTLTSLDYELLPTTTHPSAASAPFRVIYHTTLFGELQREMNASLVLEDGGWRIQWQPGLILPELEGGNRLSLDLSVPTRGEILDRNSLPLVRQAEAFSIGVDPGSLDPDQEGTLLSQLAQLTGMIPDWIKSFYESAAPGYIPIGEALAQTVRDRYTTLSNLIGLYLNPFTGRYYTEGGLAPHVTGYVLSISAEEMEQYRRQGYMMNEKIGKDGLELWAQDALRGKPSATLKLVNAQGQTVSVLGQNESQPSESITTTLDIDLQREAQKALAGFRGAIVVMERDTGRVLALASSPGFDPNLFEAENYNRNYALNDIFNQNTTPLVNRAAQGSGYPLGSVFKIISMAAALESGVFTPESTYECGYTFTDLPGETYYDWTYEKDRPASSTYFPGGMLTLSQGLMRSCNIWFYHIGLDLYRQKGAYELSNMARAFGLGSLTGIGAIGEISGAMPDPTSEGDAVQLAIGQGQMQVTPLQVARFIAAIGNGGTLYRPQIVEKIAAPESEASFTFQPEVVGQLPIKPENLKVIQDALRSVSHDRLGTAYQVFTGLNLPIYGKTGTAQNSSGTPHAWFAGYTDAKRAGKPDIAIAVLAENAGEGSEIAAPIFRRMVEVYFLGRPVRLYRWESKPYVTRTPTPLVTDTPVPPPPTETPVASETPTPTDTPEP